MKCRMPSRIRSFLPIFALAAGVAAADQILVINSDTLTSYLAGKTSVQDVKPRAEQRAVNIDGSLRASSTTGMAIAGNPFEDVWTGEAVINGVRLDTGTWATAEVDMSLPSAGIRWTIGRTYNARQDDSGHYDSNGYQGKNWFQTSQPELVFYNDGDNSKDVIYLVVGGDRYAEFQRRNSTSNQFQGKNGVTGIFDHQSGSPDLFVLTDSAGVEFTFFGFNVEAELGPGTNKADGQLWKIENAAGDKAYVGDPSTRSTAISDGFDSGGRITTAYDSEDRRYTYTYKLLDGVSRLTEVKAESKTGGTWSSPTGLTEIAKVEYTYYTNETNGDAGDLKTVKLTRPMSDSSIKDIRIKYYRYWEGAFDANSNPGYPHALKLVVDYEGARRFDWNESGSGSPGSFDNGFTGATLSELKPYGSAYIEYDSSHRVSEAWFNGECGCSGGGTGTHSFAYGTSGYTNDSGYDNEWARRTVVNRPDGSWSTQYFDEVGQSLSRITTDSNPAITSPASLAWVDNAPRDQSGLRKKYGSPENAAAYDHSTGAITKQSGSGLLLWYERVSGGDLKGFLQDVTRSQGKDGTPEYVSSREYSIQSIGVKGASLSVGMITKSVEYEDSLSVRQFSDAVAVTYGFYPNTLVVSQRDVALPAVPANNNGGGQGSQMATSFSLQGQASFSRDQDGRITYRKYDSKGGVVLEVFDADTTQSGPGELFENVGIPQGFQSSGVPTPIVQSSAYDVMGRRDEYALPGGRVEKHYYSKLADGRLVELVYSDYVAGAFYGPVAYTVMNHSGAVELEGIIALPGDVSMAPQEEHIDESDADPITAVDSGSSFGSVVQLETVLHDESGTRVEEVRSYHLVPATGPGTAANNYDWERYSYDGGGRRWRVESVTGTVVREEYDARGRKIGLWVGTNDSSFPGGTTSGPDNMVRSESYQYDNGLDGGNSNLTAHALYVGATDSGKRETTYRYGWRGERRIELGPEPPYLLHKYDNRGRRIGTAGYDDAAGLGLTKDPGTYEVGRLLYATTEYDPLGRVYRETKYEIDGATGQSLDSLETNRWYSKDGDLLKIDGESLKKWSFDRNRRPTHEYVLAEDDDSTYGDVENVTGDIVLHETQRAYNASGSLVLYATIARHHDDYGIGETLGALDTNVDDEALLFTPSDIRGRVHITAQWFDRNGRLVDRVWYGTNGGVVFDRTTAVPARTDTSLLTEYAYDTAGALQQVVDPMGRVTYREYDAKVREVKRVENFSGGSPGGGDSDRTETFEYSQGLLVSRTRVMPLGKPNQIASYAYGTVVGTASGASAISTGHLLATTTHADSTGGSDSISYAYNVQSELVHRKDQAGGEVVTDYDGVGREVHRRAVTIAPGVNGLVRRISTQYYPTGHVETVTQYDNETVGSGSVLDEVKYSYDGWGYTTAFQQDRNSIVDPVGLGDDYRVTYTYDKHIDGRNTVRRTSKVFPSGRVVTFNYLDGGGRHDNASSRVTRVRDGSTTMATYDYNGLQQLVGITLDQPDVQSLRYGTLSGSYPDFDQFDRVKTSRWVKDNAGRVEFAQTEMTYDRNRNVLSVVDGVQVGFDVLYALDDLQRVTVADEGTLQAGVVTNRTRKEAWALDQAGSWDGWSLDLDGDGLFGSQGEIDEIRTHNAANELLGRDSDKDGSNEYLLAHDAVGAITDDGNLYLYEWGAFGRLLEVRNRITQSLLAEYRYNGLGYRISVHQDTDLNGYVDSGDKWYHYAYDERWRLIATYREADLSPK